MLFFVSSKDFKKIPFCLPFYSTTTAWHATQSPAQMAASSSRTPPPAPTTAPRAATPIEIREFLRIADSPPVSSSATSFQDQVTQSLPTRCFVRCPTPARPVKPKKEKPISAYFPTVDSEVHCDNMVEKMIKLKRKARHERQEKAIAQREWCYMSLHARLCVICVNR